MKRDSKSARRYAKSFLGLAEEQGILPQVAADMALVAAGSDGHKELRAFFRSPVIKPDQKISVITKIFGSKISKASLLFLTLVVNKRREALIPEIAEAFAQLYRLHKGEILAEITRAGPLTESDRASAIALLNKMSQGYELREKVDTEIIGGFVLKVGDQQYDESVSTKLGQLKKEFSKNPYLSKI